MLRQGSALVLEDLLEANWLRRDLQLGLENCHWEMTGAHFAARQSAFWVYVFLCGDHKTFYVGMTEDVSRRMTEHCGREGAILTRLLGVKRYLGCLGVATKAEAEWLERRVYQSLRAAGRTVSMGAYPHSWFRRKNRVPPQLDPWQREAQRHPDRHGFVPAATTPTWTALHEDKEIPDEDGILAESLGCIRIRVGPAMASAIWDL